MDDAETLSHTNRECKHHVVFCLGGSKEDAISAAEAASRSGRGSDMKNYGPIRNSVGEVIMMPKCGAGPKVRRLEFDEEIADG